MNDDQEQSQNEDQQAVAGSQQSDDTQSEVEQLKAKLAAETEAKLLARADLENYRRRMDAERTKFGAMANMMIIQQLLEIMEDLQLAKNDSDMDLGRAQDILKILNDKLNIALTVAGVETIAINKGNKFDPSIAEAITSVPTEDEALNNTVADVVSLPVRFKADGSLLKTGKVVVNKFKS